MHSIEVIVNPTSSRAVVAKDIIKKNGINLIPASTVCGITAVVPKRNLNLGVAMYNAENVPLLAHLQPRIKSDDDTSDEIIPFWYVQSTPIPEHVNMTMMYDSAKGFCYLTNKKQIQKGEHLLYFNALGSPDKWMSKPKDMPMPKAVDSTDTTDGPNPKRGRRA